MVVEWLANPFQDYCTTWVYGHVEYQGYQPLPLTRKLSSSQSLICSKLIRWLVFPTFYANKGLKSFFFFMTTNIFLAIFVYFLIPETKGAHLEEVVSN